MNEFPPAQTASTPYYLYRKGQVLYTVHRGVTISNLLPAKTCWASYIHATVGSETGFLYTIIKQVYNNVP